MVIREVGIFFRGNDLINVQYHVTSGKIDHDIRSAFFTAIIDFVETTFNSNKMKYLGGEKYIVAFLEDKIASIDLPVEESFYAYMILDKEKKMEKYFNKVISPLLFKVIKKFKNMYNGKYLSKTSQFTEFKKNLDEIFGPMTQNMDQKLKTTF